MAFCSKCGNQVDDAAKFCNTCGAQTAANDDIFEKMKSFNNTTDRTGDFDRMDIENNKILALFSYLGFLFIIPLIAAPNSKYARFHANQGIILFLCSVVYGAISGVLTAIFRFPLAFIPAIFNLVGIVFLVLMIIGIVNAVNGKAQELPVIGSIKIL